MAESAIPAASTNRPSPLNRFFRREGVGVLTFILLIIGIGGPISTVFLWAFAIQWRYPALFPTSWGLDFWTETLARADIRRALPTSIVLSVIVTLLSALVCLPAAYAFARFQFRGKQFFCSPS